MPNKDKVCAVILAGGSGTRFWPLSRKKTPKQFLNIIGRRSLFEETLRRIRTKIRKENIFIITNALYARTVKKQAAAFGIPPSNILLEPEGKNTAPSIAWAAARLKAIHNDAIMVVLPSDHLILNNHAFLKNIAEAIRLAADGFLVTFGIVPTRPETGYGYLRVEKSRLKGKTVFLVKKFIEKPSKQKAQRLFKAKDYLWNSGMFAWRVTVILKEFKKHLPVFYRAFKDRNDAAYVRKVWRSLPSISIDYGILEKVRRLAAVPSKRMGWSDLGSWQALSDVLKRDTDGNILKGDIINLGSKNTFILGKSRLIAAVGLNNIVAVDTPDALLICRKDLSQDVRALAAVLQKKKRREYMD